MSELYQLPTDIRNEFTVDADGKVWASARATARLAGVSSSALCDSRHGLLTRLKKADNQVIAKNLASCLKPFAGFDFGVVAKIPDILVSAIVTYYAYEANVTNDQAKRVASTMQAVGFRVFFQTGLGLDKPISQDDIHQALKQVIQNQLEQNRYFNQQIDSIKEGVKVRLDAEAYYPNVGEIVDDLMSPVKLLPPAELKEPFTLREYIDIVQCIKLSKSECISLGRFVVDGYSTLNARKPNKHQHNYNFVYYYRDITALKIMWQTWKSIKGIAY